MDTTINPGGATADASQLNAAVPPSNAGVPVPEALTLPELNQLLGRDFKSKDSALKSIGDTFKFATTRVADVTKVAEAKVDENYKKLAEGFEAQSREMFFLQHPEHAPNRKLIESLGSNPSDVVNSDVYKEVSGKLSEHDKTVKLKTVLESNPRLAASRDNMTKAADLKKSNNGFMSEEIENLVTKGVNEAFGLN